MVAIIDMNNCYASIETSFDPRLKDKPVIVLTNNDGQAIAKNQLAKSLPIDYAQPFHLLKPTLDEYGVVYLSSNYTLYGDISGRIMRILHSFNPDMEIYSIDEAWLNFASFKNVDLVEYCKEIRRTILQGLGIEVSIGIAPSKTLAKVANRYVKKHNREEGVFCIDSEEKRLKLLKMTEINDIWGVGGQLTKKLNQMGIYNAYELSKINVDGARRLLTVTGERMVYELNGTSCIPIEYIPKRKDIIGSQKSFGVYQSEYPALELALTTYTARCAEKLRKQKSVCGVLQVIVQTNSWNANAKQYFNSITCKIDVPTDNTGELIKVAVLGLKKIFKQGYTYKRVGVMLMDLRDKSDGTQNLFTSIDREKSDKLMKVLDKVNFLNGSNTLRFGSMDFKTDWKMKQTHLTRCYTTRLTDLIQVK